MVTSIVITAGLAVGINIAVTRHLKQTWEETFYMDAMPNSTTQIKVNGAMIGMVTMKLPYISYSEYTRLYSFSQSAPFRGHRNISVYKQGHTLYSDNYFYHQFYLNRGSRMDASFSCECCINNGVQTNVSDAGVQVFVLETNRCWPDFTSQCIHETVRETKKFTKSDCQLDDGEFTFISNASTDYLILYRLWHRLAICYLHGRIGDITYRGDLTQYGLRGNESYCSPTSDSLSCSIAIPDSSEATVVLDVGNIAYFKYTDFTEILLTTTLNSSVKVTVNAVTAGVCVAAVIVVVVFILIGGKYCKGCRGRDVLRDEQTRLMDSDTSINVLGTD